MTTGPWTPEPSLGRGAKTRIVNYIRPLSIPIPMSPKQCNVTEVHSVRRGRGMLSWCPACLIALPPLVI